MVEVPYLLRKNQHRIGKAGRASEQRLARQLGGRARPASGAMEGAKSDFAFDSFLVEAKATTNESLALKHAWLVKNAREARSEGKTPALTVSFVNADGHAKTDGDYVCIPMWLFRELVSA